MQARIAILESAVDLPDTEEVPMSDPGVQGAQASVAMATGVTGGLRLGAVRNLIAGVSVVGRAKPARSDPLFQFFHFEHFQFLVFHVVSPFFCFVCGFTILNRTGQKPGGCPLDQCWLRIASLRFRKRSFRNRVVVVIVVGIAGIVMQRPNGVGSDPLLQFFNFECRATGCSSGPTISRRLMAVRDSAVDELPPELQAWSRGACR